MITNVFRFFFCRHDWQLLESKSMGNYWKLSLFCRKCLKNKQAAYKKV